MAILTWFGVVACLLNSAMFSGLTLALFGVGRLRLEVEAEGKDPRAIRVLRLRKDSNFLLTTLLWGNVSVNCLLTLLSESVLSGIGAFLFSTIGITIFGEILPQAYFSRNAMRVGSFFYPVIRAYQALMYPLAKPTARLLDLWLGKEGIEYFRERDFRFMLEKHIQSEESDIGSLEGMGALNFLSLDDLRIIEEGEIIDPESIIELPVDHHFPVFPTIERNSEDPFLQKIQASEKKWVILVDPAGDPQLVLNADAFLRGALYSKGVFRPLFYCHRPIVIRDSRTTLGQVISQFKVYPEHREDDVIDHDLVLYWNGERRILTGADLLGRLLRGIVSQQRPDFMTPSRHEEESDKRAFAFSQDPL